MIEVLDPAAARQALTSGRLRCPDCAAPVRPWGRTRTRTVRDRDGQRRTTRPDRARCTGCGVTHVMLDAALLAHRGYSAALVGQALLAAAAGAGHRCPAACRGRAARSSVRRPGAPGGPWRGRGAASRVRCPPGRPDHRRFTDHSDPLTLVLDALGAAALAFARRFARHDVDPWARINLLTRGRLLAAAPAD